MTYTVNVINVGYYDASYNFRNEELGEADPDGWSGDDAYVEVTEFKESHKKPYKLNHNPLFNTNATHRWPLYGYSAVASGTIEVYLLMNDIVSGTKRIRIYKHGEATSLQSIYIEDSDFKYIDGGKVAFGHPGLVNNIWYILRIDFECGAGGYMSLAADTFDAYIDGIQYVFGGNFDDVQTTVDAISLIISPSAGDLWTDAWGFTWEGYVIGDNLNLAVGANITSNTHEIEIRHNVRDYPECIFFNAVDDLDSDDIIKITDKYTTWKYGRGNRKDSLHFRNETWGSVPADTSQGTWLDNSGGDCAVYMIDKNNGHSNIIQFEDYDNSNNAELYFTFTSAQTDGSIEYWYMTTDPTYQFGFFCYDEGDGLAAGIHQYDDLWYYWDNTAGGSWQAMGGTAPVVGKWYRITITFDCGTDKVTYTIVDDDDIAIANADNKNMASTPTTINKIWLFTRDANLNYLVFIDAIGFTWDANYALGDNANLEITEEDATIFYGAVIKKDKKKYKEYRCRALEYEQTNIRPVQTETGYIEENLAELIIDNTNYITLTAHDGIYRATYNFMNELGKTGLDIGFVNSATLFNGQVEIVASWQGHNNILRLLNDATPGEDPVIYHNMAQATSGTIEFYLGTNDVSKRGDYYLREGTSPKIIFSIRQSKIQYFDSLGAWQDIIDPAVNDTLYLAKIVWRADNTMDIYIDTVKLVDNQLLTNDQVSGINRFYLQSVGDSVTYKYLDAFGIVGDYRYPEYVFYESGDNLYLLYEHIEPTGLKYDLKATGDKPIDNFQHAIADEDQKQWYLKLKDSGYEFALDDGSFDNQITILSTDDIHEIDGFEKMERINKVILIGGEGTTPQTAVNQDNIDTFGERIHKDTYAHITIQTGGNTELLVVANALLNRDITAPLMVFLTWHQIFYGMFQVGEYLTLGSGIKYDESDETVTEGTYVIQGINYRPEDNLLDLTLVDGLTFEKIVNRELPVENAALISQIQRYEGFTPNGKRGTGNYLINKTGVPSVKGTIVDAHTDDLSFKVADAGSNHAIGIVFDDGVVDGEECLIINNGIVQVLLKDGTASTAGNWAKTSDVAGRADMTGGSPPPAPTHFLEIGHVLQTKSGGTDVLAEIEVHFN